MNILRDYKYPKIKDLEEIEVSSMTIDSETTTRDLNVSDSATIENATIQDLSVNTSTSTSNATGTATVGDITIENELLLDESATTNMTIMHLTNLKSGSYVPDFTNISNIVSFQLRFASFVQIGDIIYVTIRLSVTKSVSLLSSNFSISLPVARQTPFTTEYESCGLGTIGDLFEGVTVSSVVGQETVSVVWDSLGITQNIFLTFSYSIL